MSGDKEGCKVDILDHMKVLKYIKNIKNPLEIAALIKELVKHERTLMKKRQCVY